MKIISVFRSILRLIGRINMFIILSIFYITIFGTAAIIVRPIRYFRQRGIKAPLSYWRKKKQTSTDRNSLLHQF